jgi:hypothetical protein
MGMIYYLGIIGNPIGLFLCAPKMPKRFEISIIHADLNVALPKKIVFQAIANTRGKMSNGHTALGINSIDIK